LRQRKEIAASGTYRPMKIYFDLTSLMTSLDNSGMSDRKDFYKQVFEITGKWWESALNVNDDRSLVWSRVKLYKDYYVPEGEHTDYLDFDTGSADTSMYDIYIKVNMGKSTEGANTLAYAGPFVRHTQSQRPISGAAFVAPYGDKVFREHKTPVTYATSVMIHEFGHIFGFTSWDTMQRHMVKVVDNKWVWYGPKVLALAREYYNCSSLEGVPLEAKNGRLGAHWNEAVLFNELMTPMAQSEGNRLSGLSLALLEDTQWYKADYTRSEHWTYLKGEGCAAISGSACPTPSPCTSGTSGFITSDFQGVGYCGSDAQGCNTTKKYSNRDCNVEAGWPSGNKAKGAWYGENCAVTKATLKYKQNGYIYTSNASMSVWAQCNDESSYSLWFKGFAVNASGEKTGEWAGVTCTAAGTTNFNTEWANYPSSVECVDPATFCAARFGSTVGTQGALCDKSCNSYGRCQKVSGTSSSPFRLFAIKRELANYGYEAKEMASGQWQCWCYSDFTRTSGSCPAV